MGKSIVSTEEGYKMRSFNIVHYITLSSTYYYYYYSNNFLESEGMAEAYTLLSAVLVKNADSLYQVLLILKQHCWSYAAAARVTAVCF